MQPGIIVKLEKENYSLKKKKKNLLLQKQIEEVKATLSKKRNKLTLSKSNEEESGVSLQSGHEKCSA